jgi:NAD-dependent deacetylase
MKPLAALIEKARYAVAFTGAGVSTFSGISDFRGAGGFYKRTDIDPERIFSLKAFLEDPSYYWLNSRDFLYNLDSKKPSLVHRVLASLGRKGLIKSVITQNVDRLHTRAGSSEVMEIHGSPEIHRCLSCHKTWTFAEIRVILDRIDVPVCDRCGGIIKPDITFFGERLPEAVIEKAFVTAARADLLLVLGSTLVVQPAASLPVETLRHGGQIVIVNNQPTPLDESAILHYSDLEEVFLYLSGEFACETERETDN